MRPKTVKLECCNDPNGEGGVKKCISPENAGGSFSEGLMTILSGMQNCEEKCLKPLLQRLNPSLNERSEQAVLRRGVRPRLLVLRYPPRSAVVNRRVFTTPLSSRLR